MRIKPSFGLFGAILSSALAWGIIRHIGDIHGNIFSRQQAHVLHVVSIKDAPACGRPSDGKVYVPPDWISFVPPEKGHSYVDPVFGCSVMRLTDGSKEETLADGTRPSFVHYYSTFSPLSANDTLLLIASNAGTWRVKDTNGNVVVRVDKMPAMNNGHPVWDASDGNVFYYAYGKTLYKATIQGNAIKKAELYTFKEYRGIVSPDAADLSQDGDHIALVGQNPNNTLDVFVWSLSGHAKTSTYTTTCKLEGDITGTQQPGCVHKLLLTPDNDIAIDFAPDGSGPEQGLRLWTGAYPLPHLQDATNHIDTGYDMNGNAVFLGIGNSTVLSGQTNPCSNEWGLDVRRLHDTSQASCLLDKLTDHHISYRGSASQPWAALSFCDSRKPGPELFKDSRGFQEPSRSNWDLYEDEIALARVDGGAIYRLAHARSRSAEDYWAQPHAAISRDGKYVVFTSNMAYPNGCPRNMRATNECTDVYLIKVR